MMAHELPINVRPRTDSLSRPSKKSIPQVRRKLPNGEKPDFGHGSKKDKPKDKSKKQTQLLPNGGKPNFGHDKTNQISLKKDQHLPNGEKPDFGKKQKAKKGLPPSEKVKPVKKEKNEDTYAGSSFHSSPEALALPKPSFKNSSPKSTQNPTMSPASSVQSFSPPKQQAPQAQQQQVKPSPAQHPMIPTQVPFVYQGLPPQGPPRYPVTAYQAPNAPYPQTGFNYTVNSQGYINFQYPGRVAPPPPPQGPFPGMAYQPMMGPAVGQKITFNDLMSSSK